MNILESASGKMTRSVMIARSLAPKEGTVAGAKTWHTGRNSVGPRHARASALRHADFPYACLPLPYEPSYVVMHRPEGQARTDALERRPVGRAKPQGVRTCPRR